MSTASQSAWQEVKSSMFSHIAYDSDQFVLSVRFKSTQKVYAYKDVPPELYEELMEAKSIGGFYNGNIQGKFKRVEEEVDPASYTVPEESEVGNDGRQKETGKACAKGREEASSEGADLKEGAEPSSAGLVNKGSGPGARPSAHGVGVGAQRSVAAEQPVPMAEASAGEYSLAPGEVLADCYVHMEPTPHWERPDGSRVCSLCHPRDGIVRAPEPQVLAALDPPKTVMEALTLLSQQSGLIQATVALSVDEARKAMTLKVSDVASYTAAGERMKHLRTVQDRATKFIDPIRAMLHKTYALAQDRLKASTQPIDTAVAHLSSERSAWSNEQERIRKQEEERLQREREEQAKKEQQERDQQLTLGAITQSLEAGDEAAAEGFLLKPIETPAPYVPPVRLESTVPQEVGISKRANWKGEVVDLAELILDIAQGICNEKQGKGRGAHMPMSFLEANMTAINQMIKAQKEASLIPGVRVFNAAVESVRRGK